jgi:GT2 family glycosyltransferase
VLDELRRYHDPVYGKFSTLVQTTFDDAVGHFADREIDLLHIDGEHTFEAVSGDFNAWLPKLSNRAVVVLHDTNVRTANFGVWRLWGELLESYPGFELPFGHGLGVLAVGREPAPEIVKLVELAMERHSEFADFFFALGERAVSVGRAARLDAKLATSRETQRRLESAVREQREMLEAAAREHRAELEATQARINMLEATLGSLFGSTSWRLTAPLRNVRGRLRRTALAARSWQWRVRRRLARGRAGVAHATAVPGSPRLVSRAGRRLAISPLISVIVPTWNTDPDLLVKAISSVRQQSYSNWELCIADDGSTDPETRAALQELAASDTRINVAFNDANRGIAAASNTALSLASGEFVAFLDHDDELIPEALYEFVGLIDEQPDVDVVYSDEDKLDGRGRPCEPFHKPDWSPEYFRGVMYVGHLLMTRRSLVESVGGFDSSFDGVQDYELVLRLSERTNRIAHIPLVLYHWRKTPLSVASSSNAKSNIAELQAQAVQAHLDRTETSATATRHSSLPHRVVLEARPRQRWPKVTIVIVTKDAPKYISRCLTSIYERTEYVPFEVVVVDNGTTDSDARAVLGRYAVKVVEFDEPFNFSRANNLGVEAATGEHVVLLNNDTEVVDADWLRTLVWHSELPGVGAVGPLLTYPEGTVQHAGVVLGFRGTADHVMRGVPADVDGYAGSLACTHEVSAVTGACLMTCRETYIESGGLSEYYATHYQDVDFCLRLRKRGLRILFTPRTRLIHHEGVSRGSEYDILDRALLLDRWKAVIDRGDPYYNPNFSLETTDYRVQQASVAA